jgi:hypothetical protein
MCCALHELVFYDANGHWLKASFSVVRSRKQIEIQRPSADNTMYGPRYYWLCQDYNDGRIQHDWYDELEPIALQALLYNLPKEVT